MGAKTTSRTVIIHNPQGLHARPVDLFVKLATGFESKIDIVKDGEKVDGKSILAVLTLGAEQGTQLSIEATGHDAEAALGALVELVEKGFAEDEEADLRKR